MRIVHFIAFMSVAGLLVTIGCSKPAAPDGQSHSGNASTPDRLEATRSTTDHRHSSRGPHGGEIIELGDEEYHAEFVHDDATCDVTIYILDGSAKKSVPIEAEEVFLNIRPKKGQPEQHRLASDPLDGEAGRSSRFVSRKNESIRAAIESAAEVRLQLMISGKAFTGRIDHHVHNGGHVHGP